MSDSESDQDDPPPVTQVYTIDDFMFVDDAHQNEVNDNVVDSQNTNDVVAPDSDEEEMRAGPSGTRSSQRVLSSDEDDDSDMSIKYHSSAEYH